MYVEQLYTNCLAEAAYYIESNGEAAIIDPIRETSPYIELAAKRGAKIKYIFETHFHADFVSGHIDLARETGALIVYGPNANPEYEVHVAKDNEVFKLGTVTLTVLHTPGHTMESSCFLLKDENGKDHALFSGDTLFVGDVGRPDLAVKGDNPITQEELAGILFESLNNKVCKLADDVLLYPAHGPGSSCGKNLGSETWSTLGEQKQSNYALRIKDKATFIKEVCDGLPPPPAYFFEDASINKKGYSSLESVLERNTKSLSVAEVEKAIADGANILDTRIADDFEKGFIPGSVNMGLNGSYALWAGTLLNIKTPLILVSDAGTEKEAITRLARVGYENVIGYLEGGFQSWMNAGKSTDTIRSIDATEFEKACKGDCKILDVRKPGEFASGQVINATNLSLAEINEKFSKLDPNANYLVHCAGGYRSMVACSILRRNGFKNLTNVRGGIAKIRLAGVEIVTPEMV